MKSLVALKGLKAKLAIVAFTGCFASTVPIRPMVFVGTSMSPTYHNGEIVMTTTAYGSIRRGDVVVIDSPDGKIVKRVAYVAGDAMPQLHITDEWVDMPYSDLRSNTRRRLRAGFRYAAIPAGYVYVLGDNRTHSVDSRYYGCFPVTAIERVVMNPKSFETPTPGRRPTGGFVACLD